MEISEVKGLTTDELQQWYSAISDELNGRQRAEAANKAFAEAVTAWRTATGFTRTPGAEWQQPEGAQDAYRVGETVTCDGVLWECVTDWNIWKPGVTGWQQKAV